MSNRVTIRGYWGEPTLPSVSFNVLCDKVWRACQRRGGVSGLQRKPVAGENPDPLMPAAINLSFKVVFPTAMNSKSALGNPATLQEVPNMFGDGTRALLHVDATANPASPPTYTETTLLEANQPHAIRFRIMKLPVEDDGDKQVALFRRQWGTGQFWRFEVRDGQAHIYRATKGYTTSLDSELDGLLALETLTLTQERRVAEIRALIFEIDQNLSLPSGSAAGFSSPATFVFIPEPRGLLRIDCVESHTTESVMIPDILSTRKVGTLWNASYPTTKALGGIYVWQSGYPQFSVEGKMRYGKLASGFDPGTIPTQGQWDASLPGTAVTFVNEDLGADPEPPFFETYGQPARLSEFVATLSTSSNRYTPFLYAAQCFKPAEARNGGDAITWDSDDHFIQGFNSVIDIDTQMEGENRRCNWTIVLRASEKNGVKELGNLHQIDPHDRMIDASLNSTQICRKGIVTSAVYNNLAQVSPSPEYLGHNAVVVLETADVWQILDDDLMQDDPIGDGLRLGLYVKTVLRGVGHTDFELALIDEDFGRILPKAAMGESFCVRPDGDVSRGDYLRDVIDKFGMGARLWWDNSTGQWRLEMPSTTVKFAFESLPNTPIPYRIEVPLDYITDYSDTYNIITVQGADDPKTGLPIVKSWIQYEGFRSPNNYNYIGRQKRMKVVRDDGLRTKDDVVFVLRSLTKKHGRSGRFVQFNTWYIPDLFPGEYITVDNHVAIVERVSSGNISGRKALIDGVMWYGKMQIVARLVLTGEKPSA